MGILASRFFAQQEPPPPEGQLEGGGGGGGGFGAPTAGPRPVGLAPPLPPVGAPSGFRPTGGEVDSSATRSHDVVTGSGFDTGTRFEDTLATQDPFASTTGDRYLEGGGAGSAGGGSVGEKKAGWFGRLVGRGGGK